jgi:hypothetical protein
MQATISSSKNLNKRHSIIYLNSPLNEAADEFATDQGIYEAPFKSKTWSKVSRLANKHHIAALRKLFPESTGIRFSAKAGCRCGCSPGFVMKHEHPNQFGRMFWVDFQASETEVNAFEDTLKKLAGEFAAEQQAHKNKLASKVVA